MATSTFKDHGPFRTVPMKVLVLGQSRTGTLCEQKSRLEPIANAFMFDTDFLKATKLALARLGYLDCYHITNMFVTPGHGEMWTAALEAKFEGKCLPFKLEDWDGLLGNFQAVSDQPCAAFAEELMDAYPEAKIILTVCDSLEQWLSSSRYLANLLETTAPTGLMAFIRKYFSPKSSDDPMAGRAVDLLMKHVYYDDMTSYTEHNAHIRQLCDAKGRDWLTFNVKSGWKPLCQFLDQQEPDEPFPETHTRVQQEFQVRQTQRRRNKAAIKNLAA